MDIFINICIYFSSTPFPGCVTPNEKINYRPLCVYTYMSIQLLSEITLRLQLQDNTKNWKYIHNYISINYIIIIQLDD